MRELHRRQEKLALSNQQGPRATSITRSMMSVALLPRRYYLLPITLEVMYFTTTVLPRWIERRHHAGGAGAAPAPVPTLVDAAVLAILGREILRAAAHQRQKSHPGGGEPHDESSHRLRQMAIERASGQRVATSNCRDGRRDQRRADLRGLIVTGPCR